MITQAEIDAALDEERANERLLEQATEFETWVARHLYDATL